MFGKILSLTVNICAYEFKVYSFLYVIKYIIVNDYLCHLCGVILTLKSNGCDIGMDTEIFKNDPQLQNSLQCIENLIAPQRLKTLQQQDPNIEILKCKLQNNRLDKEYYSLDENELLMRKVINGGHKFHAIYLPSVLIFQVLRTAHDDLGHNGFQGTYAALK